METIQRRKAVRVQATHLCRAAHCGYTVTQSCKETGQTINIQLVQATRPCLLKCPAEVKLQQMNKSHTKRVSHRLHYWPVRSLAVMELSRLSCWSVVASSLPPPPAPEHTEEELSTASPSASSTSLSIRSLDTNAFAYSFFQLNCFFFFHYCFFFLSLTLHQDSCCTFSCQNDSAAQRSQSAQTFSTCSKTPHIPLLSVL